MQHAESHKCIDGPCCGGIRNSGLSGEMVDIAHWPMPQDLKDTKCVRRGATETLNTLLVALEHGQQLVGGVDGPCRRFPYSLEKELEPGLPVTRISCGVQRTDSTRPDSA